MTNYLTMTSRVVLLCWLLQLSILQSEAAPFTDSVCPELPHSSTTMTNCSYLNNAGSFCTVTCREGFVPTTENHTKKICACTENNCNWIGADIDCQSYGSWSEWSTFSECNVLCGHGTMIRERSCTANETCQGESYDFTICIKDPCIDDVDLKMNKYEIALGGVIAIVTFSYGILICIKLRKGPCTSRNNQTDPQPSVEEDLPPSYSIISQYQLRSHHQSRNTSPESLPLYDDVVFDSEISISTDPPSYRSDESPCSSKDILEYAAVT